nr:hypothetical protein [Spirochaetota bacterium]
NEFKKTLSMNNEKIKELSAFEIGKCLFLVNKFNECIQHFSGFTKKYSDFNDMASVYYFIGESYRKTGSNQAAVDNLKRGLSLSNPEDAINRKIQKSLKELQ